MSAPGLSILLIATIIGTKNKIKSEAILDGIWLHLCLPLASFASRMDSLVCSITPSSAATTKTTISVTCAPRDRIAVKAAWPGVSRKVIISPLSRHTSKAPMCCVMPPNSSSTTRVCLKVSSNVVLPWSTWPIMVTTGWRGIASLGLAGGLQKGQVKGNGAWHFKFIDIHLFSASITSLLVVWDVGSLAIIQRIPLFFTISWMTFKLSIHFQGSS